VDDFQAAHTRQEVVLVQYTLSDLYWSPRTAYYGITYMPTACGNGVSDVWPISWLEDDYAAHAAEPAPLTISLTENGEGDFTAHLQAEEDIVDARFCMVATLDEYVTAFGGGQSHLPYHAVAFMTSTTGDVLNLDAGKTADIQKSFTVDPSWDYSKMGVACWVQKAGGTNPSPQPYGDVPIRNKVMQSAWLQAMSTGVDGDGQLARVALSPPSPNPFSGSARLSFSLPETTAARLVLYTVGGRVVKVLFEGEAVDGVHEVSWDGRDDLGNECAPGIYVARLVAGAGETAGTKLVKLP
jgi:hypothetical protein